MRAARLLLAILMTAPGCIAVDWAVDPVGCQTGSHEPIFPWYPHYLWDPPREPYTRENPPPQIPGGPQAVFGDEPAPATGQFLSTDP